MKEVPGHLPPVKPSLRHLDSSDSAAVMAPEVSSPLHLLTAAQSPTKKGSSDGAVQQEEAAEYGGAQEAKPVGTSSNIATAKSFNWASIKVCFRV